MPHTRHTDSKTLVPQLYGTPIKLPQFWSKYSYRLKLTFCYNSIKYNTHTPYTCTYTLHTHTCMHLHPHISLHEHIHKSHLLCTKYSLPHPKHPKCKISEVSESEGERDGEKVQKSRQKEGKANYVLNILSHILNIQSVKSKR